jgi:hypothetical protein
LTHCRLLVLSDGQSFDGSPEEFKAIAEAAYQHGITISTIAMGKDIARDVMSLIAKAGKGRYYEVTDIGALPRIMLSESQAARAENIQEGSTTLKEGEPQHPVLSGMSSSLLPELKGYNALSSKSDQGAEDILVSANFSDPILSVWQYGLGRVAAWMGDTGEEWTLPWSSPALQGQFWSQVVRYALPNPALGPAQVDVIASDIGLAVDASIRSAENITQMVQVTFSYAEVSGKVRTFNVPQSGPGVYHLDLTRPPEGAYRAVLSYQAGDAPAQEVAAPFSVSPPLEWLPGDAAAGQSNLLAWAKLANGEVSSLESELAVGQVTGEKVVKPQINPAWLALAALLLWPFDILIRRRWLPWQ